MKSKNLNAFPSEVAKELRTYVYRLIDPRNGQTFYVGKGRGDRVFAHVNDKLDRSADDWEDRLKRIRDIRLAGLEVVHVIHRHGLDDRTALEVEAALMDAYPGLTNLAGGKGSSDRGSMHATQILSRFSAETATIRDEDRALLITVNHSSLELPLLDATRFAWKIDVKKARAAKVILATVRGLIKGAYVAIDWFEATPKNFPDMAKGREVKGRYGFIGKEAPASVQRRFLDKRVPDRFRKQGAANPIKYTWNRTR